MISAFSYLLFLINIQKYLASTEVDAICEVAMGFSKSHTFATGWSCIENIPVPVVCDGDTSNWEGIYCASGHVYSMSIYGYGISGDIPTAIGYLTRLVSLDLSRNEFTGTIPTTFFNLIFLNYLDLSNNLLSGTLPSAIGQLINLSYLYLYSNIFSGTLPLSIGFLTNIFDIYLQSLDSVAYPCNHFTGTIPSTIGYLTSLNSLYLHSNMFSGTIPESIFKLPNLQYLWLYSNILSGPLPTFHNHNMLLSLECHYNQLTGTVPTSIGLLSTLTMLQLEVNHLTGSLPTSIGLLTNIFYVSCYVNNLTGTLPSSISNLQYLQWLSIFTNSFSGTIPTSFGKLTSLSILYMQANRFSGTLPTTFLLLENLEYCDLSYNYISGPIPENVYLLSKLAEFYISENQLTSTIPSTIQYLQNLLTLSCDSNSLIGPIPSSIGNLTKLIWLVVSYNQLSSTIPTAIGYLTNVNRLFLNSNKISGSIPSSFGLLSSLYYCDMGMNSLTGMIPSSIGNLQSLFDFAVDYNSLSSTLPATIGLMSGLSYFVMMFNKLTGSIPSTIGGMSSLVILYLYANKLQGTIPQEIGLMKNLQYIDLYNNSLIGSLPESIGNMTAIAVWNINNNKLTGTIPATIGYLTNLFSIYFANNHLTGSLPSSLGQLLRLAVLDVSSNSLSGKVPNSLRFLPFMSELYLRNNRLSGQLSSFINTTTWTRLINIDISNNALSGTLPSGSFLNNNNLRIFAATDNCIDVMIPSDFCLAINLEILALDGLMSATKCQHLFFPHTTTTTTYTLAKQLSRNIPPCLFSMSKLSTLHLSGNALTGTLPNTTTLGPALQDLTLSYNRLEGTIPLPIQRRAWTKLDLSYNSLSGTLSHDIRSKNSTQYSLKINRLSGTIPDSLRDTPSISILQGNIFQCNMDHRELPEEDTDKRSYHCGSDTFYLALYIFFGIFLLFILLSYLIMSAGFSFRLIYLLLYYHNGVGDFSFLVQKLCRMVLVMSIFSVVVLMPVYSSLSVFYGTHTFKYGWSVSAGFLTGNVATIILIVIWSMVLLCFQSMYVWQLKAKKKLAENCEPENVAVVDEVLDFNESSSVVTTMIPIEPLTSNVSPVVVFGSKVVLGCLILLDVIVIFGANAGYVYATLGASTNTTIIILQISLGIFKAVWFKLYICNLNNMLRFITGYTPKQKQEISFLSLVLIINNVLLPTLAEVAVDSNCIYNILVSPAVVGTSYSYTVCFGQIFNLCYDYATVTADISFIPPFMYRYQCSAIVITNYVSVYVYMYLFLAIQLPISAIIVKCRNRFRNEKSIGFRLFHILSHRLHKLPPSFSTSIYLSVMISNLSILLTFGIVYPPLAGLILLSVISDMYFTLQQIDQLQPEIIDEVISLEVLNIVRYFLPFSAIFLSFFLYDISQTIWAPLVLACMPIIIIILTYSIEYLTYKRSQKKITAYDQRVGQKV